MKDPETRYRILLKVYPKTYRDERGHEILSTLLDSSSSSTDARVSWREAAGIVAHGIERRLGLTSDRFAGRVLELAAMPGLAMGGALCVFLYFWGDWLPVLHHTPMAIRFGPFLTVGPAIYSTWLLVCAGSLLWPKARRPLSVITFTCTLTMWLVGKLLFASPNSWQMLLLATLAVPAILAPTTEHYRRRLPIALLAGSSMFFFFWWFGVIDRPHDMPFFETFYWYGNYDLAGGLPWLGATLLIAIVGNLALRRTDVAGALVVLASPLLIVAAAFVRETGGFGGRNAALLVAESTGVLVAPILGFAVDTAT